MIIGVNGKIGSGKDTVGLIIQYLDWYKAANSQGLSTNMSFEEWLKINTASFPFNHTPWEIKKFAGKLKEITALLTGCTVEDLEDQDFKMKKLGPEWKTMKPETATGHFNIDGFRDMTYRELLQIIGTDALRNVVHENIWVNALMADYVEKTNHNFRVPKEQYVNPIYPNWIITDMRFPNEMDTVKAKGGITIRVNRPYSTTGENGIPATFSQTQFHPSETALDNHKFNYVIDNNGSISDLIDRVRTILILNKII